MDFMHLGPLGTVCCLAAVQVLGLVSAVVARCGEGSMHQDCCQRVFVGCLVLMALTTIAALTMGPGSGMACGTTLALMVLAATWDFGTSRPAARP